jgi:hypothetical protein
LPAKAATRKTGGIEKGEEKMLDVIGVAVGMVAFLLWVAYVDSDSERRKRK